MDHGIRILEAATAIVPAKRITSALPVVVGVAPSWKTDSHRTDAANVPVIAYDFAEAESYLGYTDTWTNYTLCEFQKAFHQLYGLAPCVYVNAFDPYGNADHRNEQATVVQALAAGTLTLTDGTVVEEALIDRIVVKDAAGENTYDITDDYLIAYDDDFHVVITRVATGSIPAADSSLTILYETAKPDGVDAADIVTALNQVDQVYPILQLVPGQVVAPKWSLNATVAAAMIARANNIDDSFRCTALLDISTAAEGGADAYSEVAAIKSAAGYTDEHAICCWPLYTYDSVVYHASTHQACITAKTDYEHSGIPFVSPSNKAMVIDGAQVAAGTAVYLSRAQANSLNEIGVATTLHWEGAWRSWGNWTAAFVSSTDPKDVQIPVRRMFDYIGNTIVASFFSMVDGPLNRRTVEWFQNSVNDWLAGLKATGAILAGEVTLLESDNPITSLMAGSVTFRLNVTPVGAASDIAVTLAIDPTAYTVLWEAA